MENKPLNIALIILVGILAGISALFSINAVIQTSMAPYMSRLAEISQTQRQILDKLNVQGSAQYGSADMGPLLQKLTQIEGQMKALESRPSAAPTPARPQPPQEDYTKKHDIPIEGAYVYGDEKAPITIVGFKDFECPFCARFHQPVMDVVDANKGKVKYVIKNYPLPFHRNAQSAAKAALAAGEQGKYFEMAHQLLENVRNLGDEQYVKFAEEIGLDVKKFKADLEKNDAKYSEIIKKDMALGGQVNVRGTPTYFINGQKTQSRTVGQYQQQIDALLKQ